MLHAPSPISLWISYSRRCVPAGKVWPGIACGAARAAYTVALTDFEASLVEAGGRLVHGAAQAAPHPRHERGQVAQFDPAQVTRRLAELRP